MDGGEVVIIDVSQSVEHDHPRASEFLRKDCQNVNDFFGRTVATPIDPLTTRALFDFVTGETAPFATDADIDADLQAVLDARDADPVSPEAAARDDAVFMNAFLPVSRKPLQFHFNMTLYESMRATFVSRSRELVQR